MVKFAMGTYYKYIIADASKHRYDFMRSPIQDTSIPLHLGLSPEVPRNTFTFNGHDYTVRSILEEGDDMNPFSCPVVMAKRLVPLS